MLEEVVSLNNTMPTFKDTKKRSLLKTLWEKEKTQVSQTNFNFSAKFNLSSANAFNLDQSKYLSSGKELNPLPKLHFFVSCINPFLNKPLCLCVCCKSLWKHCGKRRNCSWRAISPFPTVFSTLFEIFLTFSSELKLLSDNAFSLEESKICHLGKGYLLTITQNLIGQMA